MKPIGAAILGATTLIGATAATARAQSPQNPSVNQQTEAPYFTPPPPPNTPASRPLFTIAGIEGHLWAPTEPHYDANNNRNLAADPLWAG